MSPYLQMTIYGFALDSIAQMPVVILKDADESNSLPIWINNMDALYIVAELIRGDASAKSDRKDFLTALLDHLNTEITEISIESMKDGLFAASISIVVAGETVKLDVRTSEALVLAMKNKMSVMVARHLLEQPATLAGEGSGQFTEVDERRFVDFLENLDPADLGKYPM